MNKSDIENDVVIRRIDGIQGEIAELRKLARIPFKEFESDTGYKLAHYHLHRALEGVFHMRVIFSRVFRAPKRPNTKNG